MSAANNLVSQMSMYMNTRVDSAHLPLPPACDVCNRTEGAGTKIQRCSRCHDRFYCGKTCQQSDWQAHKTSCVKRTIWFDKHRKCRDGTVHAGKLELITWNGEREGYTLGWGASFEEESEGLRKMFEEEFGGNVQRFHAYRPQAFRWTCCGTNANQDYGCDHHGAGSQPCTCDFCRMGKPVPDKIYNEKLPSRIGLVLPRGPDPRSFHPSYAMDAAVGRKMWKLDE